MEKRALGRATSSGRSDDNPETIKKRIERSIKKMGGHTDGHTDGRTYDTIPTFLNKD